MQLATQYPASALAPVLPWPKIGILEIVMVTSPLLTVRPNSNFLGVKVRAAGCCVSLSKRCERSFFGLALCDCFSVPDSKSCENPPPSRSGEPDDREAGFK